MNASRIFLFGISILSCAATPARVGAEGRPIARVEVSTLWVSFGEIEIGDDATDEFTVENTGNVAVEIQDVDLLGDTDPFQIDSSCPDLLEPGEECSIQVQFEPEEEGRFTGDVEIETSAGDLTVNLSGEGVRED